MTVFLVGTKGVSPDVLFQDGEECVAVFLSYIRTMLQFYVFGLNLFAAELFRGYCLYMKYLRAQH